MFNGARLDSSNTTQQAGFNNSCLVNPTGASLTQVYGLINLPQLTLSAVNVTTVIGAFSRVDTSATYTGQISSAFCFSAGVGSVLGSLPPTNNRGYHCAAFTNGNGITSGSIDNRGINVDAFTAAAGSGGTINNYAAVLNVPTGSGAGTNNNYGLLIQGAGGGTLVRSFVNSSTALSYFTGFLGVGVTTPLAQFHIVSTTVQQRTGYDPSNYYDTTVSSTGGVTFNAVGSGAGFTFSDSVNITSSLQCDSIVNDTGLAHGTYTPTLTGVTNVSSSTPRLATYMRVGNTVTVAGQIDVTPTANNTQTTIGISLPIASAFTTAYQAGGSGHTIANTAAGHGASIQADATNDRVEMDYYETHGATDTISYTFTYQVI